MDISVINAYLANLMYSVIFSKFSEHHPWIAKCEIIMSGEIEVNSGPKSNT